MFCCALCLEKIDGTDLSVLSVLCLVGVLIHIDILAEHEANLYFTGKAGQFSIDFNADYTAYKRVSRSQQQELSSNYENRDVNTETMTRGSMVAEKLIVSHPLWKGQVSVGEEYTNTRWRSSFENAEGFIQGSNNEQHGGGLYSGQQQRTA